MAGSDLVMLWETIGPPWPTDKLQANLWNALKANVIDYIARKLAPRSVVDEVHTHVDKSGGKYT